MRESRDARPDHVLVAAGRPDLWDVRAIAKLKMNALTVQSFDASICETLSASQWSSLLGISPRAVRQKCQPLLVGDRVQGGMAHMFEFDALPRAWRRKLEALKSKWHARSFAEIIDAVRVETRKKVDLRALSGGRWTSFAQFPADAQTVAHLRMKVMQVYYDAVERGVSVANAVSLAQQTWREEFKYFARQDGRDISASMRECSYDKIERLRKKIDYYGGPLAPVEGYLDGKATRHPNRTRPLPDALKRDFMARITDSRHGVPSVAAIHRDYEAFWEARDEIPGLGCRIGAEPFPITLAQLRAAAPARAVREIAGRGKLSAKTKKLLAAPPLDWTEVEPMRVVMFDDKVLDVEVLTDDGLRVFRPVIYFAYCAGTGRVLSFIAREEGRMTQLDVEGLQAAVLRDHGFHEPSIWVKERGTVSISRARKEYLERQFNGHLVIHRTMMMGGANSLGDWKQAAKGNFFGKGRLEAACFAFDWVCRTLPGQTGNIYSEQPAMLGDTTLTLETIINSAKQTRVDTSRRLIPRNKPSGSLLEESILTAAMTRVIAWTENKGTLTACEASIATGIKPPILYYSDFVAALAELFRRFNNRRGHAMQGFDKIRVPNPRLAPVAVNAMPSSHTIAPFKLVTESPNDKATRMLGQMQLYGRKIRRPDDKDIATLLHKLARPVVTANGAIVNGVRYFHGSSQAQRDAASIFGGKKVFLALYNPVSPDALYLLANPPAHVNAAAQELPQNLRPQLYEVLPRYEAPDPTNAQAMVERSRAVAEFNAPFARAVAVYAEPRLLDQSERRNELTDRMEPLRATIMSARPPIAPEPLPPSDLAEDLQAAERVMTRREQQPRALSTLDKLLADPSDDDGTPATFVKNEHPNIE